MLRQLLDDTRLDAIELQARLADAVRPAYWKRLCPALSVGRAGPIGAEARSRGRPHRRDLVRRLDDEGYCEIETLLPRARIARMRDAIATLKDAGWPPVFAFVYDAFWTVWQLPSLAGVIAAALGPDFRMRPRVWCYYVHPVAGARGWQPHADRLGTRGLSIWIPLTDATLENGCIHVIPRHLMPPGLDVDRLFEADSLPIDQFTAMLQGARAVPAEAGSVLAWDFDLIHWGGVARRPIAPRISVSAEFVLAADPTSDDGSPSTIEPSSVPSFAERLRVIAHCISLFGANDAWTFKYQDLGRRLADKVSGDP